MGIFSKQFEITVSDISEDNELSNKGILRIMQEIACIHSAQSGSSINDIKHTGQSWVILNWKLHVFSRPCWNTKLNVSTWSSNQKHISFYRDFEITDSANNLVAVATSKWILLDLNKRTFAKLTPEFLSKYPCTDKHVFAEQFNEKLVEPQDSAFAKEYIVLQRDLDTNHHVNNLNYLDFAYEALPVNIPNNFSDVEIMYKTEAILDDVLGIYYHKSGNNEYTLTIKNKHTKALNCIVKLKK